WKGIFAHHSWIVVKEKGAGGYTRFDKVAWGQPIKTNGWAADARWYGHRPTLVGSVEGPAAEALIPKIRAAVARYPYSHSGDYAVWPGPNSNSFTAYLLTAIPQAGITLPPTAVGKDWRVGAPFRPHPQRHRLSAFARRPPRRDDRLGRGRGGQRSGPCR